ncbi:27 kDa hemolymph protein-like [Hylaeus volcanicus]|uniref:27 kDa hemolymph protein-like n=1 Tax=Hylaeus volcanicus TaxID=313075 RepID=UPI0023B7F5CE|nr:27 kDa hemolymph protein-like [Hylaeus volcanicus]
MTKYLTATVVVILCGLLGYTNSQGSLPNTDEVLNKVSNVLDLNSLNVSSIPDLESLNTSAIPALNDARNLLKQKCDQNGGEGAFETADRAKGEIAQCLKSFVNVTKLQEEMEKYKPTGDLDIVFKNYCRKTPMLKSCVSNFTAAIEPCLEPKEKENKKIIQNITDSLLSFICFKEGDRIALFISADGPECLQSKQQDIGNCLNATFGSYLPPVDSNGGLLGGLESLPSLILGPKECSDVSKLQTCIVNKLETCSDPTPANIVDSIFNFIFRVTPCRGLTTARSAASSRSTISLLTTSIVFLLLRFV